MSTMFEGSCSGSYTHTDRTPRIQPRIQPDGSIAMVDTNPHNQVPDMTKLPDETLVRLLDIAEAFGGPSERLSAELSRRLG